MKHFLSLTLTLVLVAAVAFSAVPQTARAQDNTVLEVYITGLGESTLAWFNDVAFPAFEAQHPGVTMEIITGTWGDFDASVAGWITTGDGPDIIYLGSEYAATYGKLLMDMDPYLAGWEELDQFLPAALDTVTYDGHLRGLPLLMSPRPIFYRADLAEGGWDGPPLTFPDALAFVKANSAVNEETKSIEKMGFMDIGSSLFDAQEYIGYIWSAGGELYYDDGTSAFDSDAAREALQYMYDRRRVMMPTEEYAGLPAFEGTALGSGLVASGIFAMWQMPPTDDPIWESIAMGPYPAGANGSPLIQVYIDWLSVPAYAPNPELAAEFLKFICNQENAAELVNVAGFTPVRQDAWEDLRAANPVWDRLLDMAVEYGRAFSDIRASAELRPLIVEQATLYLTDQQSLDDTLMFLKEEYDAILEENGYLD